MDETKQEKNCRNSYLASTSCSCPESHIPLLRSTRVKLLRLSGPATRGYTCKVCFSECPGGSTSQKFTLQGCPPFVALLCPGHLLKDTWDMCILSSGSLNVTSSSYDFLRIFSWFVA